MSLWSRIANVVRGDRLSREIDEELASHLDEAVAQGRDPAEARRAFGASALLRREESRDIRVLGWLDALRADAIFGWRQLRKRPVTSAAAILSLALAIGACTSAFRLIDALLLRPLPVASPERLYALTRLGYWPAGKPSISDGWEYPAFQQMRAAAANDAELLAISYVEQMDLTYGSNPNQEIEKAYRQYVSGATFNAFGLRPALGRLLTEQDDQTPGAHPYAVLSYDYWTRRFGRDPRVIGQTFRSDDTLFEIVGVIEPPFTGTEPGTMTDIFVPTMMNPAVTRANSTWVRVWAKLRPSVGGGAGAVAREALRARFDVARHAFLAERAKSLNDLSKEQIDRFLNQTVRLQPAAAGVSDLQRSNRDSLAALAVLVGLVLLIACANVANLLTAQAAARAREMALRVSIGAGHGRLVQLVLVESAWLAVLAAALGGLFAWWAAPFIVSLINPPENPARLALPLDWRVLVFTGALVLGVTMLFGLAPAVRASAVKPVSSLKGGEDPRARQRLMHGLIAAQVAFCVLVLFVAGLFVATFDRLANQALGFSAERLLILETSAKPVRAPAFWDQAVERLRAVPGVERVALSDRALLDGYSSNSFIAVNGVQPNETLAFFRKVSPGWLDTMKIGLIDGRDFRAGDTASSPDGASPGEAIVNEAFAKAYFHGENPIGRSFERTYQHVPFRIVGLVRDARYNSLRDAVQPIAYVRFAPTTAGTFIVRTTSTDPLPIAPILRQEISRADPAFRVSNVRTQLALNQVYTVRERLMAMLATFFAIVALVLAGVGLYGVLDYSVLQRRREFGIRLAIGAHATDIARRLTREVFSMVLTGAAIGLVLGFAAARYLETLFFDVRATDPAMVALPSAIILAVALLAALVPVLRALRIDPVSMLRAD